MKLADGLFIKVKIFLKERKKQEGKSANVEIFTQKKKVVVAHSLFSCLSPSLSLIQNSAAARSTTSTQTLYTTR